MKPYAEFLPTKKARHEWCGLHVTESDLPSGLFPFQAWLALEALRIGRASVWADTGLGKTRIQLACAHVVAQKTGMPVLILCPLAVAGQTLEEASVMGVPAGRLGSGLPIEVINYDRLKDVDASKYSGVVLDESSILKNFAGSMRNQLVDTFSRTPYRFCFTATPAPNDHTEIGNHAEFLGIMAMQSMLSRWFVHDSMDTSEWRLKGHAETEFWRWVRSWAVCLRKPSDIGYPDDGYDLPPLTMVRHTVETDPTEGSLIPDAKLSATSMHREMRRTAKARAQAVADIIKEAWTKDRNEGASICASTEPPIQKSGSAHPNNKHPLTNGEEPSTPTTLSTGSKLKPQSKLSEAQQESAIRSFAQITGSTPWATQTCTTNRIGNAQSAGQNGPTQPDANLPSTTAIAQARSEDSCVRTAIGESGCSKTIQTCSSTLCATCWNGEPWIVWCNTDYEQDELDLVLGNAAISIRGSDPGPLKEALCAAWMGGLRPILICKPSSFGFGMNWQHCARVAFVGLSYSYEQLYQAVRRCWRFGQQREVIAHVVTADSEWSLLESIERKQADHEKLVTRMVDLMGRGALPAEPFIPPHDAEGDGWKLLGGDCVQRIQDIETGSVGYSIFSPPFASLYTYTDAEEDMGNCADDSEFFAHFEYLVPEIKRVLMPGRLVSMHCMDLPSTKERDGVIGLRDFPGELIRLFERYGFIFHSRVTIWKDPLIAMQRTKALGLIHKQLVKDSAMSRQGIADYLITMRAPGANPSPIAHGAGFDRYVGLEEPSAIRTDDPKTNKYGHEVWQRYASPVWMDIDPTDVLKYQGAREQRDERHICPLQLQVIERGIELWSNPGDLVLSPFAGVGSEGYKALQCLRRFVGIELKASYFLQATRNLTRAAECVQPSLGMEVPA